MIRKWVAVGIILLFVTIGFSPIINADSNITHQTTGSVPEQGMEFTNNRFIGNDSYSSFKCHIHVQTDSILCRSTLIHIGIPFILPYFLHCGTCIDLLDYFSGSYIYIDVSGGSSPTFIGRVCGKMTIIGFVGTIIHYYADTGFTCLVRGFDGYALYFKIRGTFF
jgi:hypothetical protein